MCSECSTNLGHCPMKFYEGTQKNKSKVLDEADVCLCHQDYNHCISNNADGHIPEINPDNPLDSINISQSFAAPQAKTTTTTTTTQAPELKQALGFEARQKDDNYFRFQELTDEIAINTQAQQNLMYAVGAKPIHDRVTLSHSKEEFILKCSFNQKDCDIEKYADYDQSVNFFSDFKLHYDQTYGNCYTFNWNRSRVVSAHRAGANYGQSIM
jgi:hypothetical protein